MPKDNRLSQLQEKLKQVLKDVEAGKVSQAKAADQITSIKEEIDQVVESYRKLIK
jgi:hypothetical protein